MLGRLNRYVKNINIFVVTIALMAGMVGCDGYIPSEDIEIRDWHDLDAIRDNLGGSYILMNDLDSTTAGYEELAGPAANGGKSWQPIGAVDQLFTGSFDGQGYEIRDLHINRPDQDAVGLFCALDQSGIIKNIGVKNATVTGYTYVGSLAGGNLGGTVSNSYSNGSVTGTGDGMNGAVVGGLLGSNRGTVSNSCSSGSVIGEATVGGLLGWNDGAVSNSYSTGSVIGEAAVGGLVGVNGYDDSCTVSNSYSSSNVTGVDAAGGLVGVNMYGTVIDSCSTGNVTGVDDVGGLVGLNQRGTVSNSYSSGNVTANSSVGGLVGRNEEGTVSNSYSSGNVTGNSYVGGLVGRDEDADTVGNSFWDIETSGQATSAGGTGKNTTEMQDIVTFSGATWDIVAVGSSGERNPSYIWNIVDSTTYPFLSWQP